MTNSVWNNGTTCGEVAIGSHIATSSEAALANPVEIYVERAVAKVTVTDGRTGEGVTPAAGIFPVGTNDGQQIYARIEGWQVADYNATGYMMKHISSDWTNDGLGINPWSTADYHRSFWATSVPFDSGSNPVQNNTWTSIAANDLGSSVYTLENTGAVTYATMDDAKNNTNLTKVIVAVTLGTYTGGSFSPVTIYKYLGANWTATTLLDAILGQINGAQYYKKVDEDNYTSITANDIELVADGQYNAVAQLKDGVVVYTTPETAATVATDACNAALKAQKALVWNGGKGYYYTTIEHLGSNNSVGQYGVVRNHVYSIGIESIEGLGTPVYDPDNVTIDPQIPTDESSYIAARINILSWRVVSKNVSLTSGSTSGS